jgi:hypothetical protein
MVLKPLESSDVFVRENIRPGRQELPELDESRPHALQIVRQLSRDVIGGARRDSFVGQDGIKTGDGDQITAPVLNQEEGDILIAPEVLGFQR